MISEKDTEVTNRAIAEGRIVSIRELSGGASILTLITDEKRGIYPRFYCAPGVLPKLDPHARVRVEGHLTSTIKKEDGKTTMLQRIEADTVAPATTMLEEVYGVKGKFFSEFSFKIYLKGSVESISETGDWIRYRIKVSGENDTRRISIRVGLRKPDRPVKIEKGDKVCAICVLTTPKREKADGTKKFFEDILVSDIAKM